MTFRRFRKNRPQPVRHHPMAFTDVADSHATDLSTWGAAITPAKRSLPPGGVRRLLELDAYGQPERIFWAGYGAAQPHVSPQSAVRRSVVLPVFRSAKPLSPLQAQQRNASWRAFNVLQIQAPRRVAFCVRRKQRREVLHAYGIAGRRGLVGRGGGYRRTADSHWRC